MRRLGILAGIAIALGAPTASVAKIDAGDVKGADVVIADIPLNDVAGVEAGTAGAYASCDPGYKALTGGAYMYPTGEAEKPSAIIFTYLTSSSVTGDQNGWYADAANGSYTPNMTLRIILKCLPAAKFADATIASDTASLANAETDSVRAECPGNKRVFAGGSFWHAPAAGPDPANANDVWTSSSTPTANGDGWYADGYAFANIELTAYAWCLPKGQLKGYRASEVEKPIGGGADEKLAGKCPASRPGAVAAGGLLHKQGQGPSESNADDTLRYSWGVLESARSFTAGARNIDGEGIRMAGRAFCLAK